MATFTRSVEVWRSLVEDLAGELPTEFLLKYIEVESGGNPCALGIANVEAGLFQTYHPDDDRYGLTFTECRTGCSGAKLVRSLSDAEKRARVAAGIAMVRAHLARARKQVEASELPWTEDTSDFWSLVKIQHGLPAVPSAFLPAFVRAIGRAPDSWDEWRAWVESLSADEVGAINSAVKRFYGDPLTRVFNNAEKTGAVFENTRGSMFHVEAYVGVALAFGASWLLASIMGGGALS